MLSINLIDYCINIWTCTAKTNLEPINISMKKAIRILTFSKFDEHTQPLFKKLNLLNFQLTMEFNLGKLMWDIKRNNYPNHIIKDFKIHKKSKADRHITLSKKNMFHCTEQSIKHASQFENELLKFKVHDMSKPYPEQFDAVFNLFTSFGYFEDESCNLETIKSIKTALNEFGFGVIDFMNAEYVIDNLVAEDVKHVEGIDFYQKRSVKNGYIVKDIAFEIDGASHKYQERVRAFTLKDFEDMFAQAGVYLLDVFGDYQLNTFHKLNSKRLILIFK